MQNFRKGRHPSLAFLNITQCLGLINDNVLKMLVILFLVSVQGGEHAPQIMFNVGICALFPFLLFSAFAGKVADRFSKRKVIVYSKAMELFVALLGMLAFYFQSIAGAYSTFFLMVSQTAIFGPVKYAILPEIVLSKRLSKANGLLTAFSFVGMILGTLLSTIISNFSEGNFLIAGGVCTAIALFGFLASIKIEETPPVPAKKEEEFIFPFGTIKVAFQEGILFAVLGAAFFFAYTAYLQLNLIPYASQVLLLEGPIAGVLFLLVAMGICLGAFLAGFLSGEKVKPSISSYAGFGMALTLFCLHFIIHDGELILFWLVLSGVFGGLWVVPLHATLQMNSPDHMRGKIMALTIVLGIVCNLLATAFLKLLSVALGVGASTGFLISGMLTLGISSWMFYVVRNKKGMPGDLPKT